MVLTLVLVVHVIACFWFPLVNVNQAWAPPLDFIYAGRGDYYRFYDYEEVTKSHQYIVLFYVAVLALGGNEMGPRTDVEIAVMFAVLLMVALYNTYIFGQMAVLMVELSKKQTNFQN